MNLIKKIFSNDPKSDSKILKILTIILPIFYIIFYLFDSRLDDFWTLVFLPIIYFITVFVVFFFLQFLLLFKYFIYFIIKIYKLKNFKENLKLFLRDNGFRIILLFLMIIITFGFFNSLK